MPSETPDIIAVHVSCPATCAPSSTSSRRLPIEWRRA
jgi:hypothetical protein